MTRLYLLVNDNGELIPTKRDCDRWSLDEDGTVTTVDIGSFEVDAQNRFMVEEIHSTIKHVVRLSVVRTDATYAQEGSHYARR